MEVVGTVLAASQIIAKVSTTLNHVYSHYKDAGDDFGVLDAQVKIMASTRNLVRNIHEGIESDVVLSDEDRAFVAMQLRNVEVAITGAHSICTAIISSSMSSKSKLSWAVKGRDRARDALARLASAESSLGIMLNLLIIRICTQLGHEQARISKTILARTSVIEGMVSDLCSKPKIQSREIHHNVHPIPPHLSSVTRKLPWILRRAIGLSEKWHARGLQLNLQTVQSEQLSIHRLFLQLKFACRIVTMTFILQQAVPPRPWFESLSFGGHVTTGNIIPEDSDAVSACRNGNVGLLKELLRQKSMTVWDRTPDSRPLIYHAISEGSTDVVRFLLEQGANAKLLSGPRYTDLLSRATAFHHVEIARLLIDYGVDIDHINSTGCTPLWVLYNPGEHGPEQQEILKMLICRGFSNINAQSCLGWTALHRAAAYGSAEDMRLLIRFGADPSLRTRTFQHTPVFISVKYGNIDTLKELISFEGNCLTSAVDRRGWTLLHIAVWRQEWELVPLLLALGCDPHTVSFASKTDEDPRLDGRRLTSWDLAGARGLDVEEHYIVALRAAGHDVEVDDEGDLFWYADD